MSAAHASERLFRSAFDDVYDAIRGAITAAGLTLESENRVLGSFTASSTRTPTSWGEKLTFTLVLNSEGDTLVKATSAASWEQHLMSEGRQTTHIETVFANLDHRLRGRTP